jgi:hypothetical protein
MREYTVKEYDKKDMLALNDMTLDEVEEAIESLDRGYFNRYLFPDIDDDFKTYTEEEYDAYRIRVALQKVYDLLDKEAKGEHEQN